jgi:hypothetical protein
VGAVVGAVVGGLAGKGAAEAVNPTDEDAYWRDAYGREPYYSDAYTYDDYAPAYRHGYQSVIEGRGDWNEARGHLQTRWDTDRESSRLSWKDAEPAAKADEAGVKPRVAGWRREGELHLVTLGDTSGATAHGVHSPIKESDE